METIESHQNNMPPVPVVAPADAAPVKPKKRKRAAKLPRESIIEPESSEQEDPDWDMDGPPLPLLSPNYEPDPGDGDFHRPSVVTRVPGLKAQMKKAVRKSSNPQANSDISASSGSDFEGKSKKPKKKGQKGKVAKKAAAAAAAAAENKSSGAEIDSDGRPPREFSLRRIFIAVRKLKCDANRKRSHSQRNCTYSEENDSTTARANSRERHGHRDMTMNSTNECTITTITTNPVPAYCYPIDTVPGNG